MQLITAKLTQVSTNMPSSPDSSSDSSTGSPGNHGNHYSDGPNPEVESCLPGVVSLTKFRYNILVFFSYFILAVYQSFALKRGKSCSFWHRFQLFGSHWGNSISIQFSCTHNLVFAKFVALFHRQRCLSMKPVQLLLPKVWPVFYKFTVVSLIVLCMCSR